MDLQQLRSETAADHERVESLVPLMAADLDQSTYVTALCRFYGFVKGWENWADTVAPSDLKPHLAERQRSVLLQSDLQHFHEAPPARLFTPDRDFPQNRAAFLGSMYVMEGSTLGGQFIAKHVEEALGLQRGAGNAYFAGYGDRTGSMWKTFQALLTAVPQDDAGAVIAAAKQTFRAFGEWMAPVSNTARPHLMHGAQDHA